MSGSRAVIGVFLAGAAVLATLIGWPEGAFAGVIGWTVPAMALLGFVLFLTFSALRHGRVGRKIVLLVALPGGIGIALGGALVFATATPGTTVRIAGGVAGGLGLATGAVGIFEYHQVPMERVAMRSRFVVMAGAFGAGGLAVAGILGAIPPYLLDAAGLSPDTVVEYGVMQLGMGVGFVLVTVTFLVGSGRGLDYLDLAVPGRRDAMYMVVGTAGILGTALVVQFLLAALGLDFAEHSTIGRLASEGGIALLIVAIVFAYITSGIGEEFLFRNGVQKYLTEGFTPAVAILVSSVIFALVHVPAYAAVDALATAGSILVVFILSLLLGVVYYRTQNVVVPIVIHGSYNAVLWVAVYV